MLLEPGDPVLISHRRLFAEDQPRFFVGLVEAYDAGLVRVWGHTWARDQYSQLYARKETAVTKVLSLVAGLMLVYLLPADTDIEQTRLDCMTRDGQLSVSLHVGERVLVDLTERLHQGPGSYFGRQGWV